MEPVDKGQNVVVGDPTRKTPGETCVDAMHDDQRFPQGPSDNEDLTDLKRRKFQSPMATYADATTRNSSLNAIPDSLPCGNGDNSEEGRHVFQLHQMSKLPILTNIEAPAGRLNPPAEPEDAIMSKLESCTSIGTSQFANRLNANAQEHLTLNEELKAGFRGLEHDLEEQKCLILGKEHEVIALQRENQQLHELISTLYSRVAQVVELQDIACEIRKEFGQLCQDVTNQLSLWNEELQHIDIEKAFAGLYRHNRGLQKYLRKCQMLLDSITEDIYLKTREGQESKETILTLKEVNSKLEQKIDKIQQQLCKEKSGQHGSYVDGLQTPFLVESTAKTMFSSISTFSNLLSKYKDSNGTNPVHLFISNYDPSNRQWDGMRIAREHHWVYLLKEYVCCHLFENFETERFTGSVNTVIFLDHEERVSRYFEYFKNCNLDKRVWHRAIFHESSEKVDHLFFDYFAVRCVNLLPWDCNFLKCELSQNHDERTGARIQEQILGLALDKQKLVESLIVAAGKVWQFHKLCLSFEPPATIFRVAAGDPFNPDYMESIDVLENDDHGSFTVPKNAFMTYPGFRLRKSIVKCQVPEITSENWS